ncbi:MAG: hypothetical protein IPF78_10465 [Flavobacteriales bacterium]|nr:hypothetical protein [Flavobacteriales bacterium]
MKKIDDIGAEICLNLWYFPDQQGIVLRIAAKGYALKGSDQEKLAVLKSLGNRPSHCDVGRRAEEASDRSG